MSSPGIRRAAMFRPPRRRSTCMKSRRPSSGRGRRRTSARTCSCASTMRERAANSCGGSHLMSPPRRTGGMRPMPGWRSRSAMRASRRSGVPQDSLQSFPEAFRVGMAARARQLGDEGVNDPKNWEQPFGTGQVHIGVSAFSDSEEKRRRALAVAREQYEGFSGVSVLAMQDFGAQPGDLNSLGLQRRHRPAGDRGQRRRAAARPGSADQGRRVHPWISG